MQDNLIEFCRILTEELRDPAGYVFVGRAVESVSPNLVGFGNVPVDCLRRRGRGKSVEERGVEHGDVRHVG